MDTNFKWMISPWGLNQHLFLQIFGFPPLNQQYVMMLNYSTAIWMTSSEQSNGKTFKVNWLKSIHCIRITLDKGKDDRLPSLDMSILHHENKLSSTWYVKPSDTGLIMNFHSVAPMQYKRSVVSGFVHRILRACSSWENFHESLMRAKTILKRNQYPD